MCRIRHHTHGVHILADQFSSSGMPAIYVWRFFFSGVRIFFLCTSVFSAVACITNQMMLIKRSQTMYEAIENLKKKHGKLKNTEN